MHRGVYALGHLPPSPHARTMAAVLACGRGAVLSHRSAAQLYGLIRYTGPIEITAPTRRRRRPGVIVHESNLDRHESHPALGHPHHQPRPHTDRPRRHPLPRLPHPSRKRRARRQAHEPRRPPTETPTRPTGTTDAVRVRGRVPHLLHAPPPAATGDQHDRGRLRSRRATGPRRSLVAELDGEEFHDDFETDRLKDADLVEAGLRVIRLTWERLTQQPTPRGRRGSDGSSPSPGSSPRRRSAPRARAAPRRRRSAGRRDARARTARRAAHEPARHATRAVPVCRVSAIRTDGS